MARPLKKGLSYFNIDCDEEEDNLSYIIAKHGAAGYGVVIRLWRKIYKNEGYFTEWNDKVNFIFSRETGINPEETRNILEDCLNEKIFDAKMYEKFGILTSHGIQKRYIKIVTEAKRKWCEINVTYSLLELITEKEELSPEVLPKIRELSTQSKVKESKVKESKRENTPAEDGIKKSNLFRQPVIPEKEDVLRVFLRHGGTKEMAKKFWDRNESTGWFARGSPITNFANLVPSFVDNWNKNEKNKNGKYNTEPSAPPLKNINEC